MNPLLYLTPEAQGPKRPWAGGGRMKVKVKTLEVLGKKGKVEEKEQIEQDTILPLRLRAD